MAESTTAWWKRATTIGLIGVAVASVIAFVVVAAGVHETATQQPAPPSQAAPTQAASAAAPKPSGALWAKTCARSPAGADVCFVEQFAIAEPQHAVMLRVQIGYMGPGGKPRMIISTPSGVWLPGGLTLTLDQNKPIALPFNTCESDGCVAAVELGQDALDRFAAGKVLTVRYLQSTSNPIDIPVQLASLAAALKTVSAK